MASRLQTSLRRFDGARQQLRSYSASSVPSLAILDDYLSISRPHFDHISPSAVRVEVFKSYQPQQTAEERVALVETLKPFSIISTMRERTPFPASLLRELPNLKLLLCSESNYPQ